MQIRLLGGVHAATDDGDPIDIGPAKCQVLLAGLALSAGAAVPVPRLVELVWGEDPPRTAEKTLQTYVTRLRKSLGSGSIDRAGAAYRLDIDPASIDVARFQRRLAAGDTGGALSEWTGTPLAGLDAPGLAGTVDALVEQWLGALESELEQLVDRDPGATIATLTELTAQHPFREGLWALLMTALYRGGRQADALAAYRRARRHLVEELGVEPGPRLQDLEQLILGQDDRLRVEALATATATAPTGTVTFGFTDIEGSSRLWATHRRQMASAVARHDEIIRRLAADHDGSVFATGGDSFGVAFHRAGDGARWAGDVQEALVAEPWPDGTDLRVRIGLHTGEAEERDGDYFGPVVNVAARIAAAGHGGQTLMSQVTATVLDGYDGRDLGTFRFEGAGADLQLFQLDDGEHPPLRTGQPYRGNLPRRVRRLFGRDNDIDAVARAVADSPIVTLVGPGGIGKTQLALAVAQVAEVDLTDGAWLVELATVGSSADLTRAVAGALDVPESSRRSLTESIVAHLRTRRALVVLDNCEHLVEGAAELAQAVADGCPQVTVLATSREGLGLADEKLIVVGPLDAAGPAVELFVERARSADSAFDPDTDREAIQEICHRLDGVPLAIELAAARARSLSPADLVARLDDRLRLLSGGRRSSVERHRTLRATIQWSYDLLTPPQRLLFQRLSIFAGSFDLRAVEVVTVDDELPVNDVDGLVGDLVERSMVAVRSGSYGRRFHLLETMRQFAAEELSAEGGSERMAARHAAFVRDEVARLGSLLTSNDEIEGAARLAELWPNLRAAFDWAFAVEDRDLATSMLRPITLQVFVRRGLGEIADWIERLLAMTPLDDEEGIALGLLWAALHYSMTQDRDRYRQLIEDCGAPDHLFVRYAYLVGVEDPDFGALELGPRMVDEMRRRGDEPLARMFDMFTGAALMTAGRFVEARAKHEALAALFRAEGPPSFLNWTLYLLGAAAAFQGDPELAETYWEESTAADVPPRTNSPNEALSARAAFRQGRRNEAYLTLLGFIGELLEVDNMAGSVMVAVEFVNMMATLGRLDDAGVVLGHLDATGLLSIEGPGFKQFVADALELVAADPEASAARAQAASQELDERGALTYMSRILAELVDGAQRQ